jgi:hypothetical protein
MYPASLRDERMHETHNIAPPGNNQQARPATPLDAGHLSPYSSSHPLSNSASPTANDTNTPADSFSTLSHYQSDYSDIDNNDPDPFFGVDFSFEAGGTPSFLEDTIPPSSRTNSFPIAPTYPQASIDGSQHHDSDTVYPLSPEQTASLHTPSPRSERKIANTIMTTHSRIPDSISPHELQKPFKASPDLSNSVSSVPQLTPDQAGSGRSSEEGLAPAATIMSGQSPRVTVSLWGKDDDAPIHAVERSFGPEDTSSTGATTGGGVSSAGDLISSNEPSPFVSPAHRDEMGNWMRNPSTGHRGLEPENRPSDEVASPNEMVTRREIEERNQEVGEWLRRNVTVAPPPIDTGVAIKLENPDNEDGIASDAIPLGDNTENKPVPGQTYYTTQGGDITPADITIMNQNRNWADAPILPRITKAGTERYQPETSQAAIHKFERLCRDNDSIVSRAATWGTRRRSLPSILDLDIENISGNFLKKLSISRGDGSSGRRPSLLQEIRTLVRKPSANINLKRSRSNHDEEGFKAAEAANRDSLPHLAPPTRTASWGKKPTPSINTALISMASNMGAIGAQHIRNGSISATSVTSPKSPFASLSVKNTLRRPRSKSDLPKSATTESSHSNLAELWKKSGGPPVSSLAKPITTHVDQDDDDDDDDDFLEDADMKVESTKLIEDIEPNFAGFQKHVLRLNPGLDKGSNSYLIDRIAHQQIIRYKSLLTAKVKHLQQGAKCPCGSLCIALGGSASILDQKGAVRGGMDPLSGRFDSSDGDITPIEGAITQESFPQDIPMPPTQTLPAEFECQLCYQAKRFQKPSDWTKHVHEDVQPFTCTWDRCRDPKIFKRKADWVRHENEGHRHLEWWTCDVEECNHTCYRRDNFLQHLVREHKFAEPKVKTKAAMKRAGGVDPTWQKVEKCHEETRQKPQEEPCRFCGKTFPTWKKLTVHLAKHMEQISLPVLRLVAAKDLDADTIISPVQDPPARTFVQIPAKREPQMQQQQHQRMPQGMTQQDSVLGYSPMQNTAGMGYTSNAESSFIFPIAQTASYPQPFYGFNNIDHTLDTHLDVSSVNTGGQVFGQASYQSVPVTTAPFVQTQTQYLPMQQNMEPFPTLNTNPLGLHEPAAMQMSYDGLMDPTSANTDPFTPQGSVSPYSHSPHQGQQQNYYHH